MRPPPKMIPFGPWPVERGAVRFPLRCKDGEAWSLVSPEDYPEAMARPWRLGTDGYARAWVWRGEPEGGVLLLLHRIIARAPHGVLVDHANRKRTDNRRRNLRPATHSQNSANRTGKQKPTSSRFRGVTLHPCGKWQAFAKHRDTAHYLGLFATEEEAAEAYNRIARKIWGRFAVLNTIPPTSEAQAA